MKGVARSSERGLITAKGQDPADAKEFDGVDDKVGMYFLPARSARLTIRGDCTIRVS